MPADEASILRAAEADRDHAQRLLDEHTKTCKVAGPAGCHDCYSLAAHAGRTQRQVELLTPAAEADVEALF